MKQSVAIVPKQLIYLLFVCAVLLGLSTFMPQPTVAPFMSAEVHFYDPSSQGLKIMPASCASDSSYFHGALSGSGDGYGMISPNGGSEYGAYAPYAGMYICVTNSSGSNVFVPAKSANELNNFKAHPPAGVTAW